MSCGALLWEFFNAMYPPIKSSVLCTAQSKSSVVLGMNKTHLHIVEVWRSLAVYLAKVYSFRSLITISVPELSEDFGSRWYVQCFAQALERAM